MSDRDQSLELIDQMSYWPKMWVIYEFWSHTCQIRRMMSWQGTLELELVAYVGSNGCELCGYHWGGFSGLCEALDLDVAIAEGEFLSGTSFILPGIFQQLIYFSSTSYYCISIQSEILGPYQSVFNFWVLSQTNFLALFLFIPLKDSYGGFALMLIMLLLIHGI